MKPKSPEDLAAETSVRGKDKYTLYLNTANMEFIKKRASKSGISASKIVDEAIANYVAIMKDRKND